MNTWLIRSGEEFWAPTGWTDSREAAMRFETRAQAVWHAVHLESDRDCVPMQLVRQEKEARR